MATPPQFARAAVAAALIALSTAPAARAGESAFASVRPLAQVNGFAAAPAVAEDGRAAVAVTDFATGRSRVLAYERSARGRWARPRVLRVSRQELLEPGVAFTGDGTQVFSWVRAARIDQEQIVEGRRVPRRGAPGPVQSLSPHGQRALFSRVTGGPGGRALVTWEDDDYALVAAESAPDAFGEAATLFDRRHFAYDAAYRPDGSLVALSQAFGSGGVQVRLRRLGGDWGAPVTLSGERTAREATLAVGPDGTVAVAWAQFGDAGYRVQVAVRRPGGEFSAPATIDPGAGEARAPGLAVLADGTVLVAWMGEARLSFLPRGAEVRVTTIAPDGDVAAARRVSASRRRVASAPQVLADAEGDALLAWQEGRRLVAARRSAAGRIGPARTVAAGRIFSLRLAGNGRGDAVAAWTEERRHRASVKVAETRF